MPLNSVAALRAARRHDLVLAYNPIPLNAGAHWIYQRGAFPAVTNPAGESPTSLDLDALPSAGLITRVQSDLPGFPNWGALFDLLWQSPDINMGTLGTTVINSIPFPARDVDGLSNGRGCVLAMSGGSAVGFTVNYTNSAGVSGRTNVSPTSAPGGGFIVFGLQSGDEGVRSIESVTVNTAVAGNITRIHVLKPCGRFLAGPLEPGQRPAVLYSRLAAGAVLVYAAQGNNTGAPNSYIRADIALES